MTVVEDLIRYRLDRARETLEEAFLPANDLFTHRQESDYEDLVTFDEGAVRPWVAQATEFVQAISALTLAESQTSDEPKATDPKG